MQQHNNTEGALHWEFFTDKFPNEHLLAVYGCITYLLADFYGNHW